jgi:pimeloyl-ACP methyl ester carboxylesterase
MKSFSISLIVASMLLFHPDCTFSMTETASEGKAAKIERGRFTVEVVGAGPDVILIPGLASPRSVWAPTVAQLRGRYRVHLVQIRGFGDAPSINAEGPVFEPFVADLTEYIRSSDLKKPAVIGHSMGGLTAATIAARHPDLLGRILIEDSLPFIGVIFVPGATVEMLRPQAEAIYKAMLARGQQPTDAGSLQTMSATETGRAQVAAWGAQSDYRVVARVFFDVASTDITSELPSITVPVTLLYPYDKAVGPEAVVDRLYADSYRKLAQARLVKITDSRHFIHLDQPEKFAAEVERFLGNAS